MRSNLKREERFFASLRMTMQYFFAALEARATEAGAAMARMKFI
jgi:hypothetical protein